MEKKRVSDSRSIQTYVVMPSHLNSYRTLFGGQLLSWIDVATGICAIRHAGRKVVTATIDYIDFYKSVYESDILNFDSYVTWTGNSSMEIRVDVYREKVTGEQELITTCYVVMVAVDENDRPVKVPELIIETDEERLLFEEAEKRNIERKNRRKK